MKTLFSIIILTAIRTSSFGQIINYSIPNGFEKSIDQKEYKLISDMSLSEVSKQYKIDSLKNGTIILSRGQGMLAFNLDNLILKCADETDHSRWPTIVQDHFKALLNSIQANNNLLAAEYEKIKSNLGIRIYPDATIEKRGGKANFIYRTDLEGTTSILMLDLPGGFKPILKKDFDLWGKTTDDVFAQALLNVDKQPMQKAVKTFDVEKFNIEFDFIENEDYAATYALDLSKNSPEMVGTWGSVVVIPNKGLVSVCKISKDRPLDFVKYIQKIKPLTDQSFEQHQNPVSKDFFWYYNGKFTYIPVNTDNKGNINIIAPVQLSTLIAENK